MVFMENLACLRSKVAVLETQLDMVLTERSHLNELLLKCGFSEGIATLMKTVAEVIDAGGVEAFEDDDIASSG